MLPRFYFLVFLYAIPSQTATIGCILCREPFIAVWQYTVGAKIQIAKQQLTHHRPAITPVPPVSIYNHCLQKQHLRRCALNSLQKGSSVVLAALRSNLGTACRVCFWSGHSVSVYDGCAILVLKFWSEWLRATAQGVLICRGLPNSAWRWCTSPLSLKAFG